MPSRYDIREQVERIERRLRQPCIYREKMLIFPSMVAATSTRCSWLYGVRILIQPNPSKPGFLYPNMPDFWVTSGNAASPHELDTWRGGYAGWTLYFDEGLVASLPSVAANCRDFRPEIRWRRLRRHIAEMRHSLP